MWPKRGKTLITLTVLVGVVSVCHNHPQCMDFRAPFTPEANLTFCTEYADLGCCGSENDEVLRQEYEYIRTRATEGDWNRCHGYVKQILCQKCSPFAAHVYDAEGSSKARTFPGLCPNYCSDFFDKCRNLIWFLDPTLATSHLLSDKRRLCDKVGLEDVDYCYPDLKTNPVLVGNLTSSQTRSRATAGCLCLEKVRGGLANPLWARHAGDGSGRLFVAEQKGRVRIYNTRTQRWNIGCFLDFSQRAEVSNFPGDERGFLGIAFHPNYASNGRFFVYYSTGKERGDVIPPELEGRARSFNTKIRISEVRVSSNDPDKADPNSERVILEVLQPYQNHNGGELMFGVDGYLYAFVGDGGGGGDPMDAGQDKTLLHGKVLRLDVDSDPSQPYTIPPDNPFVNEPGTRPEIYAYGIRNIWRCGMDRGDRQTGESRGRVLCGDVGQNAYEEIDLLKKGVNYGWNAREGYECYDDNLCGNIGQEELPIHAYGHSVGKSVTGGVFYRGCENPALNGHYIYGDYVTSRLFSLTESGGTWTNNDVNLCGSSMCQGDLVGSLNEKILSFGEDEDGEIYILSSRSAASNRCDGNIYKIVDPTTRNDPSSCETDLTASQRVTLPRRRALWETDKPLIRDAPVVRITIKIRSSSKQSRLYRTSSVSRYGRLRRRNARLSEGQRYRRRRRRQEKERNTDKLQRQRYILTSSSSSSSSLSSSEQRVPQRSRTRASNGRRRNLTSTSPKRQSKRKKQSERRRKRRRNREKGWKNKKRSSEEFCSVCEE